MNGQSSPAGTNFQQMIIRFQVELAAGCIKLRNGCLLQSRLCCGEDAAGVGHGFIQHQFVQFVADVVVRSNIASAAGLAVPVPEVKQLQEGLADE